MVKIMVKRALSIASRFERLFIANYTFLHDWFGDTFKYLKTETTQPYNDIVEVICSPYGMVHWALQYSDRVEVRATACKKHGDRENHKSK